MTESKLLVIVREDPLSPNAPLAVTRLDLGGQSFDAISHAITLFEAVSVLNLSRNKLTFIGPHVFSLPNLTSLDLSHNQIESTDGLQGLSKVRLLDLSHNRLETLSSSTKASLAPSDHAAHEGDETSEGPPSYDGLEALPLLPVILETLLVSNNKLKGYEGLLPLMDCPNLAELDLSFNSIDTDVLDQVLGKMKGLQTLSLSNNLLRTPGYRRLVLSKCLHLTSLDHRPVFPQERSCFTLSAEDPPSAPAAKSLWQYGSVDVEDVDVDIASGVLQPTLATLSPCELLMCSLVCKWWHSSARAILSHQRFLTATSRYKSSQVEWDRVQGLIAKDVKGAELREIVVIICPPICLLQCIWALLLLTETLEEVKAAHDSKGLDDLSLEDENGGVSTSADQAAEDKVEVKKKKEKKKEEHLMDFSSGTWRSNSWHACRRAVSGDCHTFLPRLQSAASELLAHVTDDGGAWQEMLTRLRARTGTSNDLEAYIPELRASDASRLGRPFGILCEWLLALERLAFASLRLHQARQKHVYLLKET
jgi:hypothetical protein